MIIIDNVAQGASEWAQLRLGIPTASCFDKIITSTGKASTQRNAYMNKLLAEWLTGEPTEGYKGEWIDRKSTRLNSSHQIISYAVFCLKKKKKKINTKKKKN